MTRSWRTTYRGPLAIHAGKEFSPETRALCEREPFRSVLLRAGIKQASDLPLGAVIGYVDLMDCYKITTKERSFGTYMSPGRFAWYICAPGEAVPPVPAHGRPGLWEWGG